ncbi:MAG: hybrid sensor histidine kinase/response regulator, partial [Planctomycetes bacterium]|nr:hybrid sensor histidine kinase/response regulator [Planctomycetota bacterium]
MNNTVHHILIVDDDEQFASSIRRTLRLAGYEPDTAASAQEGLEKIKANQYSLIISDIQMPGMDGLEFLKRIKESKPEQDVIIVSGHDRLDYTISALRDGATDYLRKPFEIEELRITVKKVIDQAEAKKRMLEMQNRLYVSQKLESLGILAGGVSHEFNNLMSGIIGYTGMALDQNDPELMKKALYNSQRAATRASEISKNLLRFARRENPQKALSDINHLITETIDIIRQEFSVSGINIHLQMAKLPEIDLEQAAIQQAFLNILINARQAILRKGDTGEIGITTYTDSDSINIEFSDSGEGISDEIKNKIFEPFFTTTGLMGGGSDGNATGLGLSVVDGIIRTHGGTVSAEDNPGGGAIIAIRFPLSDLQHKSQGKILICDDERDVRRIMGTVLEHAG